jgi:hypothetical protein
METAMATKLQWRALLALVFVTLAMAWGTVRAADVPVVTGVEWTRSSNDLKKAYLVGIANLVQVEVAYFGANPPPDTQTFVPRFARGLQGQTLDTVREGLDKWYADNPSRMDRPVLETIWFEMVVPGLAKNK